MSYLERLKNKKQVGGIPTKPTKPPKPGVLSVLSVLSVPPDAHLEKSGIEPALMNVIREYCRRTTISEQNYQEAVDYFTELVGQGHADMVMRACTEPPVYLMRTIARHEVKL